MRHILDVASFLDDDGTTQNEISPPANLRKPRQCHVRIRGGGPHPAKAETRYFGQSRDYLGMMDTSGADVFRLIRR